MRVGPGCILALLVGCYAPQLPAGAPCSPEAPSCPAPQACALVAGSYVCVEGPVADAATDSPSSDASMQADAAIDAAPLPTWTLLQTEGTTGSQLTIPATGAGNLIVVGVETSAAGAVTSVTDNAGNVYVAVPGGRATNTAVGNGVELWYAKSSLPGATLITATAPTVSAVVSWEVSGISTTDPLDAASTLDDRPISTTPFGASITTSAAGAFVVSIAIVENSVSGIRAGSAFTNDHRTFGNGWAHLTSPTSPAGSYQAQWDQPVPGRSCASSAAFVVGP